MDAARVKEDALGNRSLAGIDMGNDADIAYLPEPSLASHLEITPLKTFSC
jgi:hypothetical protein